MAYRGTAMLVTLVFLALFACLATAITASADMNMVMARNRLDSMQAAALAEAGLQLIQRHIGGIAVPETHNASDLHEAIADQLIATLDASAMLNAAAIHWDASRVLLPTITVDRDDGRDGFIRVKVLASGGAADDTTVTIVSSGYFGKAARTIYYNMTVQRGRSVLADYGIASKSPIDVGGTVVVRGVNETTEGSIMSASYSTNRPIRMTGDCSVSGDVAIVNPDGRIVKTGNAVVGGEELIGVPEPEWPQVDATVFEPFATNVYAGDGSGDLVLSNIRIPPNTNPTFSGNVTIFGVIYVESPNKIQFTGNASIIGVIVCEEPSIDNLKTNQIHFTGNMSSASVEHLPPAPEYDVLRSLTGSFLLAPGYGVEFTGNFNTINGCMVGSQFNFDGNANGRVKGGVVNLRDSSFKIGGNAVIAIDKSDTVENPAGLKTTLRLVCVSGSYYE